MDQRTNEIFSSIEDKLNRLRHSIDCKCLDCEEGDIDTAIEAERDRLLEEAKV